MKISFLFLLFAFCFTVQAQPDGDFVLVVDYTKTVDQAIAASNCDWEMMEINSKNFQIPAELVGKKIQMSAKLFPGGEALMTSHVFREMFSTGYRPATLMELLAFDQDQPDLKREFAIMALGQTWSSRDFYFETLIPALNSVRNRSQLQLRPFDHIAGQKSRYLAVRKGSEVEVMQKIKKSKPVRRKDVKKDQGEVDVCLKKTHGEEKQSGLGLKKIHGEVIMTAVEEGIISLDEVMNLIERKAYGDNPDENQEFKILIDHRRSLGELFSDMDYAKESDWLHKAITNSFIQGDIYPKYEQKIELYELTGKLFVTNDTISAPAVILKMAQEGYRPAEAHEFLAFIAQNKKVTRRYHVMCLGTAIKFPGSFYSEYFLTVISRGLKKAEVTLVEINFNLYQENAAFLGIKIED